MANTPVQCAIRMHILPKDGGSRNRLKGHPFVLVVHAVDNAAPPTIWSCQPGKVGASAGAVRREIQHERRDTVSLCDEHVPVVVERAEASGGEVERS